MEKKWGPNLEGKVVIASPGNACTHKQSKSPIFEEIGGDLGVVNLVVLACVLRATTRKGRRLFQGGKVHPPPEKILATPMYGSVPVNK